METDKLKIRNANDYIPTEVCPCLNQSNRIISNLEEKCTSHFDNYNDKYNTLNNETNHNLIPRISNIKKVNETRQKCNHILKSDIIYPGKLKRPIYDEYEKNRFNITSEYLEEYNKNRIKECQKSSPRMEKIKDYAIKGNLPDVKLKTLINQRAAVPLITSEFSNTEESINFVPQNNTACFHKKRNSLFERPIISRKNFYSENNEGRSPVINHNIPNSKANIGNYFHCNHRQCQKAHCFPDHSDSNLTKNSIGPLIVKYKKKITAPSIFNQEVFLNSTYHF